MAFGTAKEDSQSHPSLELTASPSTLQSQTSLPELCSYNNKHIFHQQILLNLHKRATDIMVSLEQHCGLELGQLANLLYLGRIQDRFQHGDGELSLRSALIHGAAI